jgi:hypothetical protein
MKVSEAIEFLETLDPDATLVVSSDEEGNEYRTAHIDDMNWGEVDGRYWSVYADEDVTDSEEEAEHEYDLYWTGDLERVVVVW